MVVVHAVLFGDTLVLTPFALEGCPICRGRGRVCRRGTFGPCGCRFETAYKDPYNRTLQAHGQVTRCRRSELRQVD